ncbi:hypothetical protein [Labilibaculum antarcticum]|uniref:Uncharacterized protein n=1 Tax=Labilibaculum antarcticum TaxID=1717717 RepID=A0A1Y1CKU1_9BACT|nr:hypothetical protein [Labilibaculum antarcticum]BAX81016.1 hypothetical protein ALGA_2703 [Labilibaculum antarcticum]
MKKATLILFLLLLPTILAFSQEWKSLHTYKKETENTVLQDGCWLKKDRKRNTEVWQQANIYNLGIDKGNEKYKSIRQIRDFYTFFNEVCIEKGHDIKWLGIASVAANQLAKTENGFLRIFIIRNKELVLFAHNGSEKVFSFAFPQIRDVYFSNEIIKGEKALKWDEKYGTIEQCEILEPLYNQLSEKAIWKLDRMAKGKGIFKLGVPKKLRFIGDIRNCKDRYKHGKNKLIPYFKNSNN